MQTDLANNRHTRRRIHIRPNLTIMKGTIADLKFIRYGDMVVPVIMGKERKKVINSISPQALYDYVNNIITVNNNAKAQSTSISGWNSSPGNTIKLLNNGSVVQTLSATVIPVLNGSTVIWVFIVNDLSSASYSANQVNLFASVNYASSAGLLYSPPFNLATATTSIAKQSGDAISFIWEIQVNLGSDALPAFILGILYSIPTSPLCGGTGGTFGGVNGASCSFPYYLSTITIQYVGGSSSGNISSITATYDGTNTYLIISASVPLSSQVTVTSIVVGVQTTQNYSQQYCNYYGFCLNGQLVESGSAIQIPYSATLPASTIAVTVTIEFSPAT